MRPESAVVISASISGVVAVASVGISALREAGAERRRIEREDRYRREDRDAALRLQGHADRVELYSQLMRSVNEVRITLILLLAAIDIEAENQPDNPLPAREERQAFTAAMKGMLPSASRVEATAVDRQVVALTKEFTGTAMKAFGAICKIPPIAAAEVNIEEALSDVESLGTQLVEACRRDLGYDSRST